jgi:hypothetical protein
MADVFISYAREDRPVVDRLVALLQQEGWSTWFDVVLQLGQDFRPEIDREIDTAACVVVVWTSTSVASTWVHQEAARGLAQRKLVEIELSSGLAATVTLVGVDGARPPVLTMSERVQVDPAKDELIRRVAVAGGLVPASDTWNAALVVHNWQERPPSHPIIAWEWTKDSNSRSRICRRVRWTTGATFECRTAIGNWWQFGYEGSAASVGYVDVTQDRHEVRLPPRDRRRERRASEFTIRFSEGGTADEGIGGFGYPTRGPALDPAQRVDAAAIERACRDAFENEADLPSELNIFSNDTGDPNDFRFAVAIHPSPHVWCRLIHRQRIRDRRRLDGVIATLRTLGWVPPEAGERTGSVLLGRRLPFVHLLETRLHSRIMFLVDVPEPQHHLITRSRSRRRRRCPCLQALQRRPGLLKRPLGQGGHELLKVLARSHPRDSTSLHPCRLVAAQTDTARLGTINDR